MKAPFTLSSAIEKAVLVMAFLPLVTVVYPETLAVAHAAQSTEQNALVFEVNSKAKTEIVENANQTSLTYDQLVQNDLLVVKVKTYLEAKGSPLAQYADEIVKQPQWQRALAISFVESNFGKRCADNNCSGIGVKPGHPSWRKYPTKLHWFKDMSQLLEKPIYKDKYTTCSKMKGVYVVPGSPRWVNGCNKVSNELLALTTQAHEERLAQLNQGSTPVVGAATEIALAK